MDLPGLLSVLCTTQSTSNILPCGSATHSLYLWLCLSLAKHPEMERWFLGTFRWLCYHSHCFSSFPVVLCLQLTRIDHPANHKSWISNITHNPTLYFLVQHYNEGWESMFFYGIQVPFIDIALHHRHFRIRVHSAVGERERKMQPHLGERGDEAGDADQACISKQLGHLGDAPDVLLAVGWREAQVLVQPMPDVVAIQGVTWDAVAHQVLLQGKAHRGLPSTGQALMVKGWKNP